MCWGAGCQAGKIARQARLPGRRGRQEARLPDRRGRQAGKARQVGRHVLGGGVPGRQSRKAIMCWGGGVPGRQIRQAGKAAR